MQKEGYLFISRIAYALILFAIMILGSRTALADDCNCSNISSFQTPFCSTATCDAQGLCTGTCVSTCTDGASCNFTNAPSIVGTCKSNACVQACQQDSDCQNPSTPACNTTSNICVGCMTSNDCSANANNTVCAKSRCTECASDSDCVSRPDGNLICESEIFNKCVECTTDASCTAKNAVCDLSNYSCACPEEKVFSQEGICELESICQSDAECEANEYCSSTHTCKAKGRCRGGLSPASCGGSRLDLNNNLQLFAKYFWDALAQGGSGAAITFKDLESKPIEYIAADGLRRLESVDEVNSIKNYNCQDSTTEGCFEKNGILIKDLRYERLGELCSIEGDYGAIYYTNDSPKISPDSEFFSGATLLKIYTIDSQKGKKYCDCIAGNGSSGGYIDTAFKKYIWSETTNNPALQFKDKSGSIIAPGFGCCGPKTNENGVISAGIDTSCAFSEDSNGIRYLCDGKSGKYPNQWHIASQGNLGCAYNTSCGYWVLSNGTDAEDASWLKCNADSNPNKLNLASFRLNPEKIIELAKFSSVSCLNTFGNSDLYQIYACKVKGEVPGIACLSGDSIEREASTSSKAYINISLGGRSEIIYCLTNGTFRNDLDGADWTSTAEINEVLNGTCETDGFTWTGSKCCGDPESEKEFYNDLALIYLPSTTNLTTPSGSARNPVNNKILKAGCWLGRPIFSGESLKSSKRFSSELIDEAKYDTSSIINFNGTFYGCNLSVSDPLTKVNSSHEKYGSGAFIGKPKPIIKASGDPANNVGETNKAACSVLKDAYIGSTKSTSFYCSMNNSWEKADYNTTFMKASKIRPDLNNTPGFLKEDCCDYRKCFNGSACINSTGYVADPNATWQADSVCVMKQTGNAEWVKFSGWKKTWDMQEEFSCDLEKQCLVDRHGLSLLNDPKDYYDREAGLGMNPRCIDDKEFIYDHYCNEGNWTSRTKLVAEQMIEGVTGDYTLFCDNATYSLNGLNYWTGKDSALNYVKNMNNFCVLTQGGKKIFGASLNTHINNSGILDILGEQANYCSNINPSQMSLDKYSACKNTGWKLYYNNLTKSMIFSKEALTLATPAKTIEERYASKSMIDTAQTLSMSTSNAMSFLNLTHDYSRIYSVSKGAKSIFGVREANFYDDSMNDYILIKYTGFTTTNVCSYVAGFTKEKDEAGLSVYCKKQGNSAYIFAYNHGGMMLVDAWTDLTAKTRVS